MYHTKAQDADRQIQDLLAAGVRRDDLYTDHGHGHSRALAKRPGLDKALHALHPEDTLVITTLDRLGHSTQKMLDFAQELGEHNIGLRVLNLGGGMDTKTPMGAMVFTVMACRPKWSWRSNLNASPTRSPGAAPLPAILAAGRQATFTVSQIRTAAKLI